MKVQYILCCFTVLLTAVVKAEESSKTITIPFVKKSVKRNFSPLHRRAVTSEKLYNYAGTAYLISVDIGTPAQTFDVVLDTGSSDFWVPGTNCSSILCPSTKFNESSSSTFKDLNTEFNISYALGYSVGTYATDTVSLGGVSIANQQFGIAASTDSVIQLQTTSVGSEPTYMNGILGLGYPALTYSNRKGTGAYNPFVFNLVSQNVIDEPIFSIYLSSASNTGWTGEITFGGTDSTKYQGDITYLPVVPASSTTTSNQQSDSDYYYWMVYAGGLGVVNSPAQNVSWSISNVAAYILDTGTSLTYFPTSIAEKLVVAMTGSEPIGSDTSSGAYVVDCNIKSSAVFQLKMLQSNDLKGTPVILNVPLSQLLVPTGQTINGTDLCMFGIVPSDNTLSGDGMYLVGDTILRSMYMVFDMKNDRIGLASSINSGSTISVNGTSTSSSDPPIDNIATSASTRLTKLVNSYGLFAAVVFTVLYTLA